MLSKEQMVELDEANQFLNFTKYVKEHAYWKKFEAKILKIKQAVLETCIAQPEDRHSVFQGKWLQLNQFMTMEEYYQKAADRLNKENNKDA